MRILKITTCHECPYRINMGFVYCEKTGASLVMFRGDIPEWCPLEEVD